MSLSRFFPRLALCLVAACARGPDTPPISVPAPAAKSTRVEEVMRERVVFEPSALGGPPPGVQVEELGKLAGKGRWLVVTDDALDAYERAEKRLPLLYFTREAYVKAMRKLSPAQVEEAVEARLRYWSPKAMNEAPRLLYIAQRDLLVNLAEAAHLAPAPVLAEVISILDATLDLLAERGEGWAFKGLPLSEVLSRVHEDDVTLIADAASIVTEAAEAAPIVADAASHRAYVTAYDDLRSLPMSLMLLQVHVRRVYYLAPVPSGHVEWLRHEGEHFRLWKGGLVRPATRRTVESVLAADPKLKLELAGFSQGRFYEDGLDVTAAQADVALGETIAQVRANPRDAAREHWTQASLRVALRRRCLRRAAEREAAPFASLIAAQVVEETGVLRRILAVGAPGSFEKAWANVERSFAVGSADASFAVRRCVVENRQEAAQHAELQEALKRLQGRARALREAPR